MLTDCNFKHWFNGHLLCTKKYFATFEGEKFGVTNMLFDCEGENYCTDFLTYKNTELILEKIKNGNDDIKN